MSSRFSQFNADEREILRILLQNFANSVSEISCNLELRTSALTLEIEELLEEIANA